jgi:hypothetical protein
VEKVHWKAGNNNYIRIVKNVLIADVTDKTKATVFLTLADEEFTLIQEPITKLIVCAMGVDDDGKPAKIVKDFCDSKYNNFADNVIEVGHLDCFYCDDNDEVIKVRYCRSYSGGVAPKGFMKFTFELIQKIK